QALHVGRALEQIVINGGDEIPVGRRSLAWWLGWLPVYGRILWRRISVGRAAPDRQGRNPDRRLGGWILRWRARRDRHLHRIRFAPARREDRGRKARQPLDHQIADDRSQLSRTLEIGLQCLPVHPQNGVGIEAGP